MSDVPLVFFAGAELVSSVKKRDVMEVRERREAGEREVAKHR